ncbi:helix-turn-helix transcriptional regulator [Caulobacter vibrioides]|uniref:helix-turn-helix transcriptional regulator n=1 Tax=Caulobacter vibrioides TaxID=155892 RepID=UPI000BB52AAC|nr:helix-turn-helix transcriptional regulator [Caulobacter vibrioides]PLR11981.1 helix-turn-helix transcriptional regulator [Caulobacter vibrioides]
MKPRPTLGPDRSVRLDAERGRDRRLVGEGGTIESVAVSWDISENTVRHHLKSVFGKIDVSRQSELVSVVSKLG